MDESNQGPPDIARRTAMAGIVGAGLLLRGSAARATTASTVGAEGGKMTTGKIDTHQHFFPPIYMETVGLATLARQMPNKKAPDWSVERAIAMADENGIRESILSVSAGPRAPDEATLFRKCNEYAAELRQRHPGRFGSFASLPLPDIDASLREAAFCLDHLNVDGFIIFTNYDGAYLGDERFVPLFEELDRRKAVVFIHPTDPPLPAAPIAPASVMEFPFETTRTATSLILAGALRRFCNIRFILSHAGGTLPYLFPRIALSVSMIPGADERVGNVREAFAAFYYDTALSADAATMSALLKVTTPDHVLFGTDFPMAPLTAITHFGQQLDAMTVPGFSGAAVFRGNAALLLGRPR